MEEQTEPVRVFIRIRPEFEDKYDKSSPVKYSNSRAPTPTLSRNNNCCSIVDSQTLKVTPPDGVYGARKSVSAVDDKIYTFDKIFPEDSNQEDIYKGVAEHVLATVRGYNTTVFAYGTTGSGKSYTMTGNKTAPGIIPRAISDLFRHIENAASQEQDVFFYVRLSYVELYNNNFRNLLENVNKDRLNNGKSPGSSQNISMSGFFSELDDGGDAAMYESKYGGTSFAAASRNHSLFPLPKHPGLQHRTDKIEVRESQSAGIFLAGPNLRIAVTSAAEAFKLIAVGNKMRAVGATACNDVSSR